jgi:hypothetical protein
MISVFNNALCISVCALSSIMLSVLNNPQLTTRYSVYSLGPDPIENSVRVLLWAAVS